MEEIKKYGLSFYETFTDSKDESFLVAKELVETLFFDMSKMSTKYCNDTFCDMPYTYSERRIDSVLLPSLSKICNSMVLVELPALRHCSSKRFKVDDSSGRIDYWCIFKGYSFVIELKQSFDCFITPQTRERKVTTLWLKMNEQLESVKEEALQYEEATKGVIRIGLHIITSYSDKEPDAHLIKKFKESIPATMERFKKDLGKRFNSLSPDMILCWRIPQKIVYSLSQTFPGLWVAAKIYQPLHHKGMVKKPSK